MAIETNLCVGGDYDGKNFCPGRGRNYFNIQKKRAYQPGDFSLSDEQIASAEIEVETYELVSFCNVVNHKIYSYWKISTMTDGEANSRFIGHLLIRLKMDT